MEHIVSVSIFSLHSIYGSNEGTGLSPHSHPFSFSSCFHPPMLLCCLSVRLSEGLYKKYLTLKKWNFVESCFDPSMNPLHVGVHMEQRADHSFLARQSVLLMCSGHSLFTADENCTSSSIAKICVLLKPMLRIERVGGGF